MQLPHSDILDIAHFSRLFDNKSECYKLFWFQAIARKIKEGQKIITFEALINEMIADAWYMVLEYRLNLGPNDALERVVHRLGEISNMKSCEKKEVILEYLEACNDKEVIAMKRTLSQNVPYRLQAPFMESMKGKEWNRSGKNLAERINQEQRLMYYFLRFSGLNTQIQIQGEWADYIERNYEIIQGWVELNLIQYLQRRNPSVPDWNMYFPLLCKMEYLSYELMWEYPEVHKAFDKCAKEHLNNLEIRHKLYQKGLSETEFFGRLEEVMFPVYQSAKSMGFSSWSLRT